MLRHAWLQGTAQEGRALQDKDSIVVKPEVEAPKLLAKEKSLREREREGETQNGNASSEE